MTSVKKILFVVLDCVDEYEVFIPQYYLSIQGYHVDMTSPHKKSGSVIKIIKFNLQGKQIISDQGYRTDVDYHSLNYDNYDAIMVAGGRYPKANEDINKLGYIIRMFLKNDKPISCICNENLILGKDGIKEWSHTYSALAVGPELVFICAKYFKKEVFSYGQAMNPINLPTWYFDGNWETEITIDPNYHLIVHNRD